MADKNIDLNIKTSADTSGVDKAQSALNKLSSAAAGAGESEGAKQTTAAYDEQAESVAKLAEISAEHHAKMAEVQDELIGQLGEVKAELEGVTEAEKDAADGAEEMADNVRDIARAQKAAALAQLATQIGKVSGKFRDAAGEIEEFDKVEAEALRNTADNIDDVSAAVSGIALGFATGGPIGAGLAAVGVGISALIDKFMEAEVAAARSAHEVRTALDDEAAAVREVTAAAGDRAFELSHDKIEKNIRLQNDALSDGLALLHEHVAAARERRQEQEKILQAEDKLKLAEIDNQEASGEITADEAREKRAQVEMDAVTRKRGEEKQQAAEDAEVEKSESQLRSDAFSKTLAERDSVIANLEAQKEELKKAQNTSASVVRRDELIESVQNDRKNTRPSLFSLPGEYRKAKKSFDDTEFSLRSENRGVTPKSAAEAEEKVQRKVEKSQAQLDRLNAQIEADAKAARAAGRKAGAADMVRDEKIENIDTIANAEDRTVAVTDSTRAIKEQQQKEAQRKARQERENDPEKQRIAEAKIGRDAANLIPEDASNKLKRSILAVSSKLQDGDQGGELESIAGLLDQLLSTLEKRGGKGQVEVSALAARIKRLESR